MEPGGQTLQPLELEEEEEELPPEEEAPEEELLEEEELPPEEPPEEEVGQTGGPQLVKEGSQQSGGFAEQRGTGLIPGQKPA